MFGAAKRREERANWPDPRSEFLHQLADEIREIRSPAPRHARGLRLAFAGAVVFALLLPLAAFAGRSQVAAAGTTAGSTVKAVVSVLQADTSQRDGDDEGKQGVDEDFRREENDGVALEDDDEDDGPEDDTDDGGAIGPTDDGSPEGDTDDGGGYDTDDDGGGDTDDGSPEDGETDDGGGYDTDDGDTDDDTDDGGGGDDTDD